MKKILIQSSILIKTQDKLRESIVSALLMSLSVLLLFFTGLLSSCGTVPGVPAPADDPGPAVRGTPALPLPVPPIGLKLYAVNYDNLYSVDLQTGAYSIVDNGNWSGAAGMGQIGEHLYIVLGDIMWDAFKREPTYFVGGMNWTGTEAITLNQGQNNLNYVVRNGNLYSFQEGAETNPSYIIGGLDQTVALAGVYSYDAVFSISHNQLLLTQGGSTIQIGTFNWEGTTGMTYIANRSDPTTGYLYMICKDVLYRCDINTGAPIQVSTGWTGTQGMASSPELLGGYLFVIQNGTLYQVSPNDGARTQLGAGGFWSGVNKAFIVD